MKQLNIHIFQHVPFEGPATIRDWAIIKGHKFKITEFYKTFTLPEINKVDFLIIMGGPMSFDEYERYPWLKDEIEFIKLAIGKNKAVIGICLGAQLIVRALGGTAKHGREKEIGWYPVTFNKNALQQSGFDFIPEEMVVFHWHTDTFDMPHGALHLASSGAYPNQAYFYKDRVLGLQFHCEIDFNTIMQLIKNAGRELVTSEHVQTIETIFNQNHFLQDNNRIMRMILDKIESNLAESEK